jgi:lactoylglutathione lyase
MHTCIRVLDPDRSIAFYSALGFEERGRKRVGGDTATIIFLGLPGDSDRLELTINDDRSEPYDVGSGYGHIALAIDDLDAELVRLAAADITPERAPYISGPGGSKICFVQDPDGYRIEMIEVPTRR